MGKEAVEKIIPRGCYCYEYKDNGERYVCPFWSMDLTKEYQENGYCKYLKRGDWEDYGGLIWDQVKECDVNHEIPLSFWHD